MILEEYKEKLTALERKHKKEINQLMAEFANSNSSIQVGDFFIDRIGVIKVESIDVYRDKSKPTLIYYGAEYTKKLQPKKSGTKRHAYQMNAANPVNQQPIRGKSNGYFG